MSQQPHVTPATGEQEEEGNSPLGLLAFALGAFAFAAVIQFTDTWDSQIAGNVGGRRAGWKSLLENIGQGPVVAIIVVVGLLSLGGAVLGFRKERRAG